MFPVRSCTTAIYNILFLSHCLSFRPISPFTVRLRPLPSSLLHLKPIFPAITKPRNMSSKPPSVFDKMMSSARASGAKKKPETSSPSKKRKSPEPKPSDKTGLIPKNDEALPSNDLQSSDSQPSRGGEVSNGSKNGAENADSENALTVKKPRLSAEDCIAKLKSKPGSFNPRSAAFWEDGERIPFLFLARVFDAVDKESGRIAITEIVCNMLRLVIATTPDDLVPVVYLLANRIAPAHEGIELGIGEASIVKALAEACGTKESHIKSKNQELGDLGLVAKTCRSSQSLMRRPEPLTIVKVFDTFRLIAKESGKDSQEKKKNHIKRLLVAATDCEPQYLIRLLQSKMRIGLAEQTLLAALGQAAVYADKHSSPPSHIASPFEEAAKIVKQVYSVIPLYDRILPALLTGGVWNLTKTCHFTPGVPVGPMLSKATKGVSEILDKFQNMEFTCEYKYDGERAQVIASSLKSLILYFGEYKYDGELAQIHYLENGSVEIYSRNAERNTGKFPDVVAAVSRLKNPSVSSFVLDCEIVAYDRAKQKILPFQTLSTRARKNVLMSEIKVDVCIFAFDILYVNGKTLLEEQLTVRREQLYKSFEEDPGYLQFATYLTSNDLEEIQKFLDASVDACCEGLIIKTLSRDATYEPSKRTNNWLKLKKDYMKSIGDSLDLVPIGAFHGRGKRTGVYGAFLLACYDSNNEEYQSICKIGTGFSEVILEERSNSLRSKVIPNPKPYYRFGETLTPDVWFEPTEVWEVKAADLTISPVHRAAKGIVDADKGISLRFPRLVRIREDKSPEMATSSEQVAEMYSAQKNNQHNNQQDDEED